MNLTCTPKAEIGLIGSMQFIGWMVASFFIPRLADIYGRKYIVIGSIFLQLCSFIGLFLSRSAITTIVMMFFMGFAGAGRCSICFLYLLELLPQTKQTLTGTILQLNNGLIPIWMSIYFWTISKNWVYIELLATGFTAVSIFGAFFLPESPKFLLSKHKWGEARGALTYIAKINGCPPFTGKFDRERMSMQFDRAKVREGLINTQISYSTEDD